MSIHFAIALALCKVLEIETYLAGTIAYMMTCSSPERVCGREATTEVSALLQLGGGGMSSNETWRGIPGEPVQVHLPR